MKKIIKIILILLLIFPEFIFSQNTCYNCRKNNYIFDKFNNIVKIVINDLKSKEDQLIWFNGEYFFKKDIDSSKVSLREKLLSNKGSENQEYSLKYNKNYYKIKTSNDKKNIVGIEIYNNNIKTEDIYHNQKQSLLIRNIYGKKNKTEIYKITNNKTYCIEEFLTGGYYSETISGKHYFYNQDGSINKVHDYNVFKKTLHSLLLKKTIENIRQEISHIMKKNYPQYNDDIINIVIDSFLKFKDDYNYKVEKNEIVYGTFINNIPYYIFRKNSARFILNPNSGQIEKIDFIEVEY